MRRFGDAFGERAISDNISSRRGRAAKDCAFGSLSDSIRDEFLQRVAGDLVDDIFVAELLEWLGKNFEQRGLNSSGGKRSLLGEIRRALRINPLFNQVIVNALHFFASGLKPDCHGGHGAARNQGSKSTGRPSGGVQSLAHSAFSFVRTFFVGFARSLLNKIPKLICWAGFNPLHFLRRGFVCASLCDRSLHRKINLARLHVDRAHHGKIIRSLFRALQN